MKNEFNQEVIHFLIMHKVGRGFLSQPRLTNTIYSARVWLSHIQPPLLFHNRAEAQEALRAWLIGLYNKELTHPYTEGEFDILPVEFKVNYDG